MIPPFTLVLLYHVADELNFFVKLTPGELFSTHKGIITHDAIMMLNYGEIASSHKEEAFLVVRPSLNDIMMHVKRHTQIIYPKDIGYILLKLGVRYQDRVIEAGTGSGALTIALAYSVFPDGHVYSYERMPEFSQKAQKNLVMAGIEHLVTLKERDIGTEGFDETHVDAVFLDMKDPSLALPHAYSALKPGGNVGLLLPTTNQVSSAIAVCEEIGFSHIEVTEILVRHYKINAQRLRPEDRMVAHTGFLLFAKKTLTITPPICP